LEAQFQDLKVAQMKTILTLLMTILSTLSQAAVTVAPVHLNVQNDQRSTSLSIINNSDNSSTLDVRVMKWLGQDSQGVDRLQNTDSVILSRPVVVVPAHDQVTIRIIVKDRSIFEDEETYRVLVNDISAPLANGKMAVRMNSVLPLFVLNSQNSFGTLELSDGLLKNTGTRHVRIANYKDKQGKTVNFLRYVMPGQSIKLPVASLEQVTHSDDVY